MKQILLFTSLLIFLFSGFVFCQQKLKPVAKVGAEEISSQEFKIRYELMPRLSKDYYDTDSLKKEFLYSLIAEKLWAEGAKSEGLDTLEYLKYFINHIEKLLVRDELYKKEIDSKIKISDADVSEALKRNSVKLEVNILSSDDSSKIFKLYALLKDSLSLDSINTLNDNNIEPSFQIISFGDLDDATMEDSIYNLKKEEFTTPLKNDYGWFIFQLENTFLKDSMNNLNSESTRQIKDLIRERRAKKLGIKYLKNLLKGKRINYDDKIFWMLTDKFFAALKKGEKNINDSTKVETFSLAEYDILKIIEDISPDTLNMVFIPMKNNNLSLKEFLYDLTMNGFEVARLDKNLVASKLNSVIKIYIQNQLVTQEGYKIGFQKSPEIKAELNMWRENYLANILRNKQFKSIEVTSDEVKQEYNRIYNSSTPVTEVNILEILTDNLDIIQLILNKLSMGEDFRELAKKYSIRESTKAAGGEFGFFPVTAHGEIGKQAAKLKVGEVYGPLKLAEGYSIFKLIDKKEASAPSNKTYEEVKSALKEDLSFQKFIKHFYNYTGELADKFGVTINQKNLSAVSVSNINMFTYKFIGFGGVMTALPFTNSWYEWFDIWKNSKKVNP